jgi:pimeloyl-ACP methyl ester carboxylesterase
LAEAKGGRLKGKEAVGGFPTERDAPPWAFLRAIGDFDPMEHWKQVKVPIVFVYGGHDTQIRVTKSVRRIFDMLDPLNLNYTLIVSHKNRHALYRDDQLEFLAKWIQDGGRP